MPRKNSPKPACGKEALQTANPDAAWFDDRLDRVGMSRLSLSLEYDPASKNWLNKILKGERRCQIGEAAWLAEKLKEPGVEVIRRLGYRLPAAVCPTIGIVNRESRVELLPPTQQDMVAAPPDSRADTVALKIETGASALAIYNGTLLYYTPTEVIRPDALGRLSVLLMGDSEQAAVGIIERGALGKVRVVMLDGKTTFETARLRAASPVEWTRST